METVFLLYNGNTVKYDMLSIISYVPEVKKPNVLRRVKEDYKQEKILIKEDYQTRKYNRKKKKRSYNRLC